MLSDRSRPVVEATLPVVGEHIGEIADASTSTCSRHHPELLDGIFNRGNQADGPSSRRWPGRSRRSPPRWSPRPVGVPENLLSRIAHKHASLGISPDQYQVVHDNLMWAIVDVLGDAVTPEVAAAWDEVYWLMANALINQERGSTARAGSDRRRSGGSGRCERKIRETDDVVTFVVKRIDDRLVKTSLPGQYVTVKMPMPDGVRQPRQYSLTRADDGEHRQFSVKRVHGGGKPDGEVSTLLHDEVDVGDVLTLSLPYGDVVLDDAGRPVVFASAGIGITPMAGMLSHLVAAGSGLQIMVLHADLDEASFALRRQVVSDVLALRNASMHLWYEKRTGSNEPVDGVHPGMMDLYQVDLARRRQVLPVRPDPVHAGCAERADRRAWRPATSNTRCSAPTCGRPTSTDEPWVATAGSGSPRQPCPEWDRKLLEEQVVLCTVPRGRVGDRAHSASKSSGQVVSMNRRNCSTSSAGAGPPLTGRVLLVTAATSSTVSSAWIGMPRCRARRRRR